MASRKRTNLSFNGTTDRLSTKKEKENSFVPSCPPLNRKFKSYFRTAHGDPKSISYYYDRKLSDLYKRNCKLPYIKQVFAIYDKIGEGSYANVYRVRSKEDGKLYAIKISKRVDSNPSMRYAEAYRLERLGSHPNIIKYFGAWEEKEHVFIQLELYDTSLDKYAKANHKICEEQLWDILIDLLLALKHLHDLKFVHLDIKPDNIMISDDGVYKLGDFGLLIDLVEFKENRERYCRLSDGDAKYLARETLEGHYTPAADIFSLGITMLELATDLVLPSNGPLWHQMRNGFLPEEYTKDIPTALLRIIKSMMNDSYVNRPTVNQLLKVEPIKTKLQERNRIARINYYKKWCESNAVNSQDDTPIVEVFVRLNNPNHDENALSDDENPQIIIPNNSNITSTPCVTPPRRVSQVVLYTV